MDTHDMRDDLIRRYYENTLALLEDAETSAKKQEILHEAVISTSMHFERIPRNN